MVARRLGYKSQNAQLTLSAGGVTHDFVLAANPLQLGEVVVTGAGTSSSTEKLGSVRNSVSSDLISKAGETKHGAVTRRQSPQRHGDSAVRRPRGELVHQHPRISTLARLETSRCSLVDGVPTDNSTFSTSISTPRMTVAEPWPRVVRPEGTVNTNRAADINPKRHRVGRDSEGSRGERDLRRAGGGGRGAHHHQVRSVWCDAFHVPVLHVVQRYQPRLPLQTGFGQGTNGIHADTSVGGQCEPGRGRCFAAAAGARAIPAGATVYDHANDIYRVGHTLDNGFSVSGGNDRTTFYLSGDYNHDQGVIIAPTTSSRGPLCASRGRTA